MKYLPAVAATIVLAAAGCAAPQALAQGKARYCGELGGTGGQPLDYRKGHGEYAAQLEQVDRGVFSGDAEAGKKAGITAETLDRALHVFPNHTPALAAMVRLALMEKKVRLPGARYPVECYFDRAQRLAPDDAAVYATYANYLVGLGMNDKAVELYQHANRLDGANPVVHYNLGLAYFKMKKYQEANKHAQRAYAAGFPLPGLKSMLTQAGQWRELPPEAAPAPLAVPVVEAAAQPEPKKE